MRCSKNSFSVSKNAFPNQLVAAYKTEWFVPVPLELEDAGKIS